MEGFDFVWCKGICSVSAYEGRRDISYKFNRYGGLFNPAGEIVQGILLKENGRGIVISMRGREVLSKKEVRPRSPFQISEDDMREFYFGSIRDLLKFRHSSDASIEKVIKKANAMPRLIEEFYRSINVRRT